jgi:predicted anti-sigma-YlaC factor YlaD
MQVFNVSGHLSEDSLGLHALNDLPSSQGHRAEEHLAECVSCRSRATQAKTFTALLKALARHSNASLSH